MASTRDRDPSEIVSRPSSDRVRVRVGRGPRRRSFWRRHRRWILGGLTLGLVLLAVSAVRYYLAYSALQDGRTQVLAARDLLTGDLNHLDLQRVELARSKLEAAAADFGPKSSLVDDGLLAKLASDLPGLSTNVKAARALRTSGEAGAQLGLDVLKLLEDVVPASAGQSGGGSPFQRLVTLASQHRDELDRASADVEGFRQSLAAIPTEPLLGPLDRARQTLLGEGTKIADSAGPALGILHALPAAIGPGKHSYLLLLENPGEERPGGGYIGAVGEVTFTDGAITTLDFKGGEFYSNLVTSIPAPKPLDAHLFHGVHWELADANWSPDFPTSMADVENFYSLATGRKVDGDISIDPVALSYVLKVLGPIRVAPYPQVITADNVLSELNYITNEARPQDPGKVFLPPFGSLLTHQLLQAPIAQMPPIADALNHGAREKHVALYFHDPQLQSLVDAAGYGGRLDSPLSDSLLVDDANLSGTKGDLFVKRDMHLTVKVTADGDVQNQLTLDYTNPTVTNPADKRLVLGSGGDYRDYVRVFVPETAQVSSMTVSFNGAKAEPVGPEEVTFGLGHAAIGYWLIVPRGGSAQLVLTYSGPFADISVTPEHYQLLWMKQVNALPWPVDVAVTMPDGRSIRWSGTLDTDRTWSAEG